MILSFSKIMRGDYRRTSPSSHRFIILYKYLFATHQQAVASKTKKRKSIGYTISYYFVPFLTNTFMSAIKPALKPVVHGTFVTSVHAYDYTRYIHPEASNCDRQH